MTEGTEGFVKSLSNITFDRTAGSHSLAATGQRGRSLDSSRSGQLALSSYTRCPEVVSR